MERRKSVALHQVSDHAFSVEKKPEPVKKTKEGENQYAGYNQGYPAFAMHPNYQVPMFDHYGMQNPYMYMPMMQPYPGSEQQGKDKYPMGYPYMPYNVYPGYPTQADAEKARQFAKPEDAQKNPYTQSYYKQY